MTTEKRAGLSVPLPLNQNFLPALSFCHFPLLIPNPSVTFPAPKQHICHELPWLPIRHLCTAASPLSCPFCPGPCQLTPLGAIHVHPPPFCYMCSEIQTSKVLHTPMGNQQLLLPGTGPRLHCWQIWRNVPRHRTDVSKTEMGPMGTGSAWGRWNPTAISC